jgi:hypothetical protein
MFIIGRLIYLFFAIIAFSIFFRLVFLFFGIFNDNPFVSLVMNWGGFFAGPFFGILPSFDLPAPLGIIETGSLIALVVYAILGQLLAAIFR